MPRTTSPLRPDGFKLSAYAFVTFFAALCVLPFWMLVAASLTPEADLVRSGYRLIPERISFEAYRFILADSNIFAHYGVSVFITAVGTALALLTTSTLAYAIANRRNRLARPLSYFTYFPMLFSGGLVPFYILVSQWLDLKDSLWAVILPLMISPFFVFVMVSFFRNIPQELIESGRLDGANEFTIFFRLVVPISTPILATIGLFYALVYWNDWFMALLFISDESKYPLQMLLRRLISSLQTAGLYGQQVPSYQVPAYQARMAMTVLTIGPIVLAYPFVQRYFVQGLTVGSVKG